MNGDETVYGPATVSGDKVEYKKNKWEEGMNGDETVYGPATVGGTEVKYNSKKGTRAQTN